MALTLIDGDAPRKRGVRMLGAWLFLTAWLALASAASAGTLAQFRTIYGDIEVELYDQDKPVTVQNFMRYVNAGLYKDSIFHRCPVDIISGLSGFVVQGGGIYTSNRFVTPGLYYLPTFPPIRNETSQGRFFSNTYGTIAMARTSDPDSATSQFFFNLGNNSVSLDNTNISGGYTVFGHTIGGTNVLNQFIGRSFGDRVVNLGGVLAELPVSYTGARGPSYEELIYVDVTLLSVKVTMTNSVRTISWNSVSNRVNKVEFTTQFPPQWQTLVTTNGNGQRLQASDSASPSQPRFYRVQVNYSGQ
jgi:peptidyl-prolyl cis-trans isomerase A (cyclophilin A)